jgi:hypothetical protein
LSDAPLDALRARHEPAARAVGVVKRSSVPVDVALREALVVADFVEQRWEATVDDAGRAVPGMSSAGHLFARAVAAEIRELHALAAAEQRAAGRARRESMATLKARGEALVRELDAAAVTLRDLGGVTALAAPLARVKARRAQAGRSAEAIGEVLDAYLEVLAPYAGALAGVAAFRAGVIDEADATAEALYERPVAKAARRTEALGDAYLALLAERVKRARATARWVYREHPAVVREVTSAWERAKRRRRTKG